MPHTHTHTDDDGSVSFEEFTKYMLELSIMESRSETPDSPASEEDFQPLLTTPTLEVAMITS